MLPVMLVPPLVRLEEIYKSESENRRERDGRRGRGAGVEGGMIGERASEGELPGHF